jgi:hypothetical protein
VTDPTVHFFDAFPGVTEPGKAERHYPPRSDAVKGGVAVRYRGRPLTASNRGGTPTVMKAGPSPSTGESLPELIKRSLCCVSVLDIGKNDYVPVLQPERRTSLKLVGVIPVIEDPGRDLSSNRSVGR